MLFLPDCFGSSSLDGCIKFQIPAHEDWIWIQKVKKLLNWSRKCMKGTYDIDLLSTLSTMINADLLLCLLCHQDVNSSSKKTVWELSIILSPMLRLVRKERICTDRGANMWVAVRMPWDWRHTCELRLEAHIRAHIQNIQIHKYLWYN